MRDEAEKTGDHREGSLHGRGPPQRTSKRRRCQRVVQGKRGADGWEGLAGRVPPNPQVSTEQKTARAQDEFVRRLAEQRNVEYLLKPYRVNFDGEGFPSVGPSDAPITLVEFSDFECPFCSQFVATLEEVKKKYGDQVRLVFRQFPLSIHANAPKAAEASLCAEDQDKFWPMHDLLFEEQSRLDVAALKEKAGRLALNRTEFDHCLDSGKHAEQVKKDMRAGGMVGVTGTPALFVNGIPAPSGALPYEAVSAFIEDELRRLE